MTNHVVILVLGDIGRSPRMQYHALSLLKNFPSMQITLVGYEGEVLIRPLVDFEDRARLNVIRISLTSQYLSGLMEFLRKISILHAFCKGLHLLFLLIYHLWVLPSYSLIIIQNPPFLPALIATYLVGQIQNTFGRKRHKIMIDWHNLGFKMYENSLGSRHFLVRVSKFLEVNLSSIADYHICVSHALKDWLHNNCALTATTLYDRPAAIFKFYGLDEVHSLLSKLGFTDELFNNYSNVEYSNTGNDEVTIQTVLDSNQFTTRRVDSQRTALLMSSTSWTADEDFGMLLEALVQLDSLLVTYFDANHHSIESNATFSRVLVVVTGKGPLKERFEMDMRALVSSGRLGRRVVVKTVWLEPQEYPLLMSCADLGVCLHTSTSGLDLPMKVLDMFGSGVPVLAVHFPCLYELVRDGENGLIFQNSEELKDGIVRLLFPSITTASERRKDLEELHQLRDTAKQIESWDENWERIMLPMLKLG